MDKEEIVKKTADFVKDKLEGAESGHGWWHVSRVRQASRYLAQKEKADLFITELAALLHDIADWKFTGGDGSGAGRIAAEWLQSLGVESGVIDQICAIIRDLSFKGAKVPSEVLTLEGKIVQDADRLDALGASGIARAFAYGGYSGRRIHDPEIKPQAHGTFEEYKNFRGTTINHFYEKLLLLKDRMNTESAREIAESRHSFLEQFLKQFYREWNGEDLTPDS